MDVRLRRLRVGARPDRPDRVALGDHPAHVDERRPELRERHRVAVRRPNRHHLAVAGHRADERDRASSGRAYRRADLTTDVDAAMLPPAYGSVPTANGRSTGPPSGQRPGLGRSGKQRDEQDDEEQSAQYNSLFSL